MNIAEFRQMIVAIANQHFPQAQLAFNERRGVELNTRIKIDETTFISIYYSSLTEKKSYALVRNSNRIFGYDNSRFWHQHPAENPQEHIACEESGTKQVFREMSQILNQKSKIENS
jgi:hypothetical protein